MDISIIGYGKMGKAIEKIAIQKGHRIVSIIQSGEDLDQLATNKPDVAIEFTQPESAFNNLSFCLKNQIPVLSGTTGWLDQYDELVSICNDHNGTFLHASNFSIGVNLFFEFNDWLSRKIEGKGFNCEIEEIHHTQKKDSPSGTAIKLAQDVIKNSSQYTNWVNESNNNPNNLLIISKREAEVPGTHHVLYDSELESIRIEHVAKDRSVFAHGVILVSEWLYKRKGIFDMSDFINQG